MVPCGRLCCLLLAGLGIIYILKSPQLVTQTRVPEVQCRQEGERQVPYRVSALCALKSSTFFASQWIAKTRMQSVSALGVPQLLHVCMCGRCCSASKSYLGVQIVRRPAAAPLLGAHMLLRARSQTVRKMRWRIAQQSDT